MLPWLGGPSCFTIVIVVISIILVEASLVACLLLLSCFSRLGFIAALSDSLSQLSRGPLPSGGFTNNENINATSGLKTRLPA